MGNTSILNDVKHFCGIESAITHFDSQLVMLINTIFSQLTQLGVKGISTLTISSSNTLWSDLFEITEELQYIQTFVSLKVKEMFDPPQSSSAMDALKRNIDMYEWRINIAVDPGGNQND